MDNHSYHKYSYIIDEGHVDPTKKNHNAKIIGLNWYYKESKQRVYLLNSQNPSLEEDSGYYIVPPGQLSKYKHLELNALEENTSGIYFVTLRSDRFLKSFRVVKI